MKNAQLELSPSSKTRIESLLSRAMHDSTFRKMLLDSPKQALAQESVSEFEVRLLSRLYSDELEEAGIDIRRYRDLLRADGKKC